MTNAHASYLKSLQQISNNLRGHDKAQASLVLEHLRAREQCEDCVADEKSSNVADEENSFIVARAESGALHGELSAGATRTPMEEIDDLLCAKYQNTL